MFRSGKMNRSQLMVLIGAAMYQMALVGILINSGGVLLAQIQAEFGFSVTHVSTHLSIVSITTALAGAFMAALFFRTDKRSFFASMIALVVISYLLLAAKPDSVIWYISPVLRGLSSATSAIMVSYLLNQWMPDTAASATGFAMAFSGLGGMVFNPITSGLISAVGWRMTILILAAVTVAFAVPALILMFRQPMPDSPPAAQKEKAGEKGSFLNPVFLLCTVVFLGGALAMQFISYISIFAQSMGHSLAVGAFMTSMMMAGNIVGKLIFGVVCDRIGVWKTVVLSLALIVCSMVLFVLLPGFLPALYFAAMIFGIDYALVMIGVPRVCISAYGAEGSKRYIGLHTSINSAIGAVFPLLLGILVDKTGSFNLFFGIIVVSCVCSAAAAAVLSRKTA